MYAQCEWVMLNTGILAVYILSIHMYVPMRRSADD
jgi:hypothetical protein